MNRTWSLILYVVGILLLITAAKLPIFYGHSAALLAVLLAGAGGIIFAVAWIGALLRTAREARWGWFALVLLFSVVSLLVYLLWGPTPERLASVEVTEQ